ncbi:MAG: C4-dicarboxylate ABC transporter permease [Deltaproteobacteria bacterium RBG_16_48_10]|nr:MAG: C4-dicarboxylate ABC transporter permease [Deltaproteobacteria bacterium RBG_16_48_10]
MTALLPELIGKAIAATCVAMSVYHLYTGYFGAPEALLHRSTHLLFTLLLIFSLFPFSKEEWNKKFRWTDGPLILLILASIGYIFFNYEYFITRYPYVHPLSGADMTFGILLTLLLMEGSRRVIGPALPITAGVFLAYAYVGPYLPGLLRHTGFTTEAIVDQLYMTTEGIFGIPLGVSATYVILFIIFGTFLEKSGTGQLFMDFASAITGWTRGGPGKISCISSALFGTISGSAVANVMVDGWLTIPLMKRTGFNPPFACAVEATASTGGQIMPPVMGAAAFVMAEFLGIPYITICLYAMIPALLYYFSLFMSIHFMAGKMGLKGIPREELPRLKKVLAARGHMFIPLGIIVYMMTAGYTPMYACIYSTVAVVVLSMLRKETRMGFWTIVKALEEGAKNTLGVAAACACAGVVIGVINLTGLGLKFTSFVLFLAGESLIPALIMTMLAGIVLGMGMPTTPAYIVQAALLIPALIKLGVMNIAAHMFVFYFSTISAITPPVAMAVYAAAGIGGAKLWPTGIWAMRIAAAGFIVPYMFVYGPSLLFIGSAFDIITSAISASFGVMALAAGMMGWFVKEVKPWERIVLLAAAVLLIKPGLYTDAVGYILLLFVFLEQKYWHRS